MCRLGRCIACGAIPLQVQRSVQLEHGAVPCDVQFDPLSRQYLLVVSRSGLLALYDVATMTEVCMGLCGATLWYS